MANFTPRRGFLQAACLGAVAGPLVGREEVILAGAIDGNGDDAGQPARPKYEGEPLPHGTLGSLSISRLILGGNLIGGYAHSRDLLYVSRLLREYNTESRIFDTLALAEASGVNTIQLNPGCYDFVERYRKERGGAIQTILNVDVEYDDMTRVRDQVQELAGRGVHALYTHGMVTDRCVMNGQLDRVAKVVDLIRASGLPAGIGSHSLETTIAAEKEGIPTDFYVKTLHPDTYWSNSPEEVRDEWCWYRPNSADHDGYHDNYFCANPPRTIEVFDKITKPWLAFKVMAAGAMSPQIGFTYAFKNGADFLIAGMFDFQIADDVGIAVKAVKRSQSRPRAWRA